MNFVKKVTKVNAFIIMDRLDRCKVAAVHHINCHFRLLIQTVIVVKPIIQSVLLSNKNKIVFR